MKIFLFSLFILLLLISSCYMSAEQRSSVLNFDLDDEWNDKLDRKTPPGEDVPITENDIIVREKGYGEESNETNSTI